MPKTCSYLQLVLVTIFMLAISDAGHAQSDIKCNSEVEGTEVGGGNLTCTNISGDTEIVFRRIPAWGHNAGLVIIDICRQLETPTVSDPSDIFIGESTQTEESRRTCIRRYCSDEYQYFGIGISGASIPFGWGALLGLSLYIEKTEFEVVCKNL